MISGKGWLMQRRWLLSVIGALCMGCLLAACTGESGRVSGVVTSSEMGTVLPGVAVRIGGGETKTDSQGKYSLNTAGSGTLKMSAELSGYQPYSREIRVERRTSIVLDFALIRSTNTGAAASPGTIPPTPTTPSTPPAASTASLPTVQSAQSAQPGGLAAFTPDAPASQPIAPVRSLPNAVAQVRAGAIAGRVTSRESGAGLARATVRLGSASSTVDGAGAYSLSDVGAGLQTVNIELAGYIPRSREVIVRSGRELEADFQLDRIPGSTEGVLIGIVRDAISGDPMPNMEVGDYWGPLKTDMAGEFVWRVQDPDSEEPTHLTLGPGPRHYMRRFDVELRAGQAVTIDFPLTPVPLTKPLLVPPSGAAYDLGDIFYEKSSEVPPVAAWEEYAAGVWDVKSYSYASPFNAPCQVEIPVDVPAGNLDASAGSELFSAAYWDGTQWVPIGGRLTSHRSFEFELTHFSKFTVLKYHLPLLPVTTEHFRVVSLAPGEDVAQVAKRLEDAWEMLVPIMGFLEPIPTLANEPIYVWIMPIMSSAGLTEPSSLAERLYDYVNYNIHLSAGLSGVAASATPAHEFFHVVQINGYLHPYKVNDLAPYLWWMEATATWIGSITADQEGAFGLGAEYARLESLATAPLVGQPLDSRENLHPYLVGPFVQFLESKSPGLVVETWKRIGTLALPMTSLIDACQAKGIDLPTAYAEFLLDYQFTRSLPWLAWEVSAERLGIGVVASPTFTLTSGGPGLAATAARMSVSAAGTELQVSLAQGSKPGSALLGTVYKSGDAWTGVRFDALATATELTVPIPTGVQAAGFVLVGSQGTASVAISSWQFALPAVPQPAPTVIASTLPDAAATEERADSAVKVRASGLLATLTSLDRDESEDHVTLRFAVTREGDVGRHGLIPVQVRLVDDHGNSYSSEVNLLSPALLSSVGPFDNVASMLPEGFTYSVARDVGIPRSAPIVSIQVADNEAIPIGMFRARALVLSRGTNAALLEKGTLTRLSEFLAFRVNGIVPRLGTWAISVTASNADYNASECKFLALVESADGTLSWDGGATAAVRALSSTDAELMLNGQRGRPVPDAAVVLLFVYTTDGRYREMKLWPVGKEDFPLRVGQGLGENETPFVDAYKRHGMWEQMGYPVDVPHTLSSQQGAQSESHVLIQTFPAANGGGQSAIVWDQLAVAPKAWVLEGGFLASYLGGDGPERQALDGTKLGAPVGDATLVRSSFGSTALVQQFEGGYLVQREQPGSEEVPFFVAASVSGVWNEEGVGGGALGFPTTAMTEAPRSGARGSTCRGYIQGFEGGHVLSFGEPGDPLQTLGLTSTMDALYMSNGGPASPLGFPIGGVYRDVAHRQPQCDFEGGYIASADGISYRAYAYEPGLIAFVSDRDGNQEIYLSDASGRSPVNLTRNRANDWGPSWSPDGGLIAFVSDRGGGVQPGIYTMRPDGTDLRLVTYGDDPSWFPDGKRIICTSASLCERRPDVTNERLYVVDCGTREVQRLDPVAATVARGSWLTHADFVGKQHFASPAVSPDGRTVAFSIGNWGGGWEYKSCVMDVDGNNLRPVVRPNGWGGGTLPSWSPDGTKLAFRADPGEAVYGRGKGGVWVSDLSDKPAAWLGYTTCGGIDWTPDGEALAISGIDGYDTDVWIVNTARDTVRITTSGKGNNWGPTWCSLPSKVGLCQPLNVLYGELFSRLVPDLLLALGQARAHDQMIRSLVAKGETDSASELLRGEVLRASAEVVLWKSAVEFEIAQGMVFVGITEKVMEFSRLQSIRGSLDAAMSKGQAGIAALQDLLSSVAAGTMNAEAAVEQFRTLSAGLRTVVTDVQVQLMAELGQALSAALESTGCAFGINDARVSGIYSRQCDIADVTLEVANAVTQLFSP